MSILKASSITLVKLEEVVKAIYPRIIIPEAFCEEISNTNWEGREKYERQFVRELGQINESFGATPVREIFRKYIPGKFKIIISPKKYKTQVIYIRYERYPNARLEKDRYWSCASIDIHYK